MLSLAHDRADPPPPPRDAEEIALHALSFIAWRSDELSAFLFSTGLERSTIREAAKTPAFLSGVLDYVVGDSRVLHRIAGALEIKPEAIDAARRALLPKASVTPVTFGPGPLTEVCEHCRKERWLDRRHFPYVPARVGVIQVARCGPCGGGFGGPEAWIDRDGREVGPD